MADCEKSDYKRKAVPRAQKAEGGGLAARAGHCPSCERDAGKDWKPTLGPVILLTLESMPFGGALKESDEVVLFTNFDEAECLRRLHDALDAESRKSIFSGEVAGTFDAQGFRLEFGENASYQYALPYFRGRLIREIHSTRVEGRFMVPRYGTVYLRLVQTAFIGPSVFLLILFAYKNALPLSPICLPILLIGMFLPKMVGRMARRHKKKLSKFLENALMAQIEPRP